MQFERDAAEPVAFDADALEQIVGNLISNVEKYGAAGKYMKLTSRRLGDVIEITVTDRGPGLPQREKHRIFEPFYRVSSALTGRRCRNRDRPRDCTGLSPTSRR